LLTLLSKIDVLMLGRMDTFDSVGLYTVGYKFADLLSMVSSTVVGPVTTLLVATWPAQSEMFRQRTREAAMLLAVLGATATAAFWSSADGVLSLLYGERFAEAAGASRMLVLGSALSMLTELGLMVLIATGRHRVYTWLGRAAHHSSAGCSSRPEAPASTRGWHWPRSPGTSVRTSSSSPACRSTGRRWRRCSPRLRCSSRSGSWWSGASGSGVCSPSPRPW